MDLIARLRAEADALDAEVAAIAERAILLRRCAMEKRTAASDLAARLLLERIEAERARRAEEDR